MSLSYPGLGIGVAMAIVIVALGEYIGETFQEKKERTFLDETRDSLSAAPVWSIPQECRPSWPA
jgi:hypothetical protein